MPELPEVETLRRFLEKTVIGRQIEDVRFLRPEILRQKTPEEFHAAVCGKRIEGVGRRGKYLLFTLCAPEVPPQETASAYNLVVHLKMRGSLHVEALEQLPEPYLCAALRLSHGTELRFYDMWRWGEWTLVPRGDFSGLPGLAKMGPEPFDPEFTPNALARQLAKRRGLLKTVLLDQQTVAGVGNIYCDESLHRAGLHPARTTQSLGEADVVRLHSALLAVLEQAIAQGGTYAEQQARQNGNIEGFENIYTPQVYDRPGQPCPRCKTSLVKYQLRGRGTTFCPLCQPDANIPPGKDTGQPVRVERSGL